MKPRGSRITATPCVGTTGNTAHEGSFATPRSVPRGGDCTLATLEGEAGGAATTDVLSAAGFDGGAGAAVLSGAAPANTGAATASAHAASAPATRFLNPRTASVRPLGLQRPAAHAGGAGLGHEQRAVVRERHRARRGEAGEARDRGAIGREHVHLARALGRDRHAPDR